MPKCLNVGGPLEGLIRGSVHSGFCSTCSTRTSTRSTGGQDRRRVYSAVPSLPCSPVHAVQGQVQEVQGSRTGGGSLPLFRPFRVPHYMQYKDKYKKYSGPGPEGGRKEGIITSIQPQRLMRRSTLLHKHNTTLPPLLKKREPVGEGVRYEMNHCRQILLPYETLHGMNPGSKQMPIRVPDRLKSRTMKHEVLLITHEALMTHVTIAQVSRHRRPTPPQSINWEIMVS
jgi:hypothetical protein